jgi:hypothetical protein
VFNSGSYRIWLPVIYGIWILKQWRALLPTIEAELS